MGFLDDAKKLGELAEDLAGGVAGGRFKDQVDSAGDKAADFVDGLKRD